MSCRPHVASTSLNVRSIVLFAAHLAILNSAGCGAQRGTQNSDVMDGADLVARHVEARGGRDVLVRELDTVERHGTVTVSTPTGQSHGPYRTCWRDRMVSVLSMDAGSASYSEPQFPRIIEINPDCRSMSNGGVFVED